VFFQPVTCAETYCLRCHGKELAHIVLGQVEELWLVGDLSHRFTEKLRNLVDQSLDAEVFGALPDFNAVLRRKLRFQMLHAKFLDICPEEESLSKQR